LLNDQLSALLDARRVSLRTHQVIQQNLRWAFVYNLAVLFPAAFGYVPPWLAAIGMSLSSLLVVMSALRLRQA
jgi:Cu2+-exporting ATPase